MNKKINPKDWKKPRGYSNGVEAKGATLYIAGQIGWDATCNFRSDDFIQQCRQALLNVVAVLNEAQAGPEHIVRMTWYLKDKREYLARESELGKVYQEVMGKNFPAMTAVQIVDFIEDRALVEIEVTAVKP